MNKSLNSTEVAKLCPNLPIEVTSLPYTPTTAAQIASLTTCILNGISCPVATVENLLVFYVILRTRSLRTVLNISVLCLAFTDLVISLLIQPTFIAYQAWKFTHGTYACVPYFIKTVFEFWCFGLSFVTLYLITLERYFAVFKPFHYQASATPLRVVMVILSGWLAWTVFSFGLRFSSSGMNLKVYSIISSILITFTLLQTIFIYVRIYKVTKAAERQIHNATRINRTDVNMQETKAAKTLVLITGTFFLCFMPTLCVSVVHQAGVVGHDVTSHVIYPLAESALFLTALINPALYGWRNTSIWGRLKEIMAINRFTRQ